MNSMKTKIIYISGNEVFDMADIRAAFDEVRSTLNLGGDTVLFGVPVDADDALAKNTSAEKTDNTDEIIAPDTVPHIETVSHDTEIIDTVATTDVAPDAPVQPKKSRGRRRAVTTDGAPEQPHDEVSAPDAPSEKIIPILSILAAKKDSDTPAENDTPDADITIASAEDSADADASIVADIDISAEIAEPVTTDGAAVQTTTIADMITDDAPSAPIEKTLEQLLESMAPLREDTVEDTVAHETDTAEPENDDVAMMSDASDATLEQLAAEFAENQDKIPALQKADTHSKIGKLKNILPFKKAKRDDSGIMGDLFGWAGIAANDDDFSIPGFFTNAASKK